MSKGHLALLIAVVVAGNLLSSPALAQQGSQSGAEEDTWTVPRTPDGRPVLQGSVSYTHQPLPTSDLV